MKNQILGLMAGFMFLGGASVQAQDCQYPDQVTYCGEEGTGKVYDWDSRELVEAIIANAGDFAKLTAEGRTRLIKAKVEVLPSKNPKDYTNITQFTLVAGPKGSWVRPSRPEDEAALVLRSYVDKRIMDDSPTIWESSGVVRPN